MKGAEGQFFGNGDAYARHGADDGTAWASLSDNPESTVSYQEATVLIPCSLRTVKRLVAANKLEFTRTGTSSNGQVRIYVWSLRDYRESRKGLK